MSNTRKTVLRIGIILGAVVAVGFCVLPRVITNNRETPRNTCINNLRLIDGAKQQWALETHKAASAVPTWADLKPYIEPMSPKEIQCPLRGTYTLGAVSNPPTCSIPGHSLLP